MKANVGHRQLKQSLGHIVALGTLLFPALLNAAHETSRSSKSKGLLNRVGPPSEMVISEFKKAGMQNVRGHPLSDGEYARMRAALDALPPLHRDVLEKHLHRLSFVDGIPGEGTGLTSPASQEGQYDLTFRASIIEEPLSNFLTIKERRVFGSDEQSKSVTVTGTGTDALTYVLLHESSHILDFSCGINTSFPNSFNEGIWTEYHTMIPALAQTPVAKTYFRGSSPLSIDQASVVYDSLAASPFVSLYSTASAREDFAELVAWREMQLKYGSTLTVSLEAGDKGVKKSWFPLASALVEARYNRVDLMEASGHGCPVLNQKMRKS